MESSKVGYWLQVGANIGILVGLIMVGLQINQNTELTRLNFYSSEEDGYLSMGATLSGETLAAAWAKAIEHPESLTTTEMVQLEGYLENLWTQFGRRDYLHDEGLYEVSAEENISWIAKRIFGNTFAQAWWQEKRKTLVDDSWLLLKDAMDEAIAEIDNSTQAQKFENIRRRIVEVQSGE